MNADERPSECDSCGQSLTSFATEKLADGHCPLCLNPHTEGVGAP